VAADWIKQAKDRESKEQEEAARAYEIRLDRVARLKTVFPDWQRTLVTSLGHLVQELATTFPDDLTRNYSINETSHGCILLPQGFPAASMEITFDIPTQTLTVKRAVRSHYRSEYELPKMSLGRIEITEQSQVFVSYGVVRYADPAQLADALVRELTGF
jgi:hypothetical protein